MGLLALASAPPPRATGLLKGVQGGEPRDTVNSLKQELDGSDFSNFSTQRFWDNKCVRACIQDSSKGVGVEEVVYLHQELKGIVFRQQSGCGID